MSTGQRQRVKLAQAIAHDPALVLLDEPTDGLDPVQRDDMLALIRRIGTEFGIDVLLSSHLLEEVERVCDDAVILHDGHGRRRPARSTSCAAPAKGWSSSSTPTQGGARVVDQCPRAAGAEVRDDGVGCSSRATSDLFDLVRDAVVDAGAGIRRLQPRTVSLEDVFLGVDQ